MMTFGQFSHLCCASNLRYTKPPEIEKVELYVFSHFVSFGQKRTLEKDSLMTFDHFQHSFFVSDLTFMIDKAIRDTKIVIMY